MAEGQAQKKRVELKVVKQLNKREMLMLIHNDMLRELCIAEINVKDFKMRQTISVNPGENNQLTQNLTNWENTVKNIRRTISVVDEMLRTELFIEKKDTKLAN